MCEKCDDFETIVMENENGVEVEFQVVGQITVEEVNYYVVIDPDGEQTDSQTDVLVMKEIEEDVYQEVVEDDAAEILKLIESAWEADVPNSEE